MTTTLNPSTHNPVGPSTELNLDHTLTNAENDFQIPSALLESNPFVNLPGVLGCQDPFAYDNQARLALVTTSTSHVVKFVHLNDDEGFQTVTKRRNKSTPSSAHQMVCSLPSANNPKFSYKAGLAKFTPVRVAVRSGPDKMKGKDKGGGGVPLNSSLGKT